MVIKKASAKSEHYDLEAIARARHLRQTSVDATHWERHYLDPLSNEAWLLDYPNSERHGEGVPRLRKF